MAKIKTIEKTIWEVEGFDVKFKWHDGKDVHGNLDKNTKNYPYIKAAKNDMNVSEWKQTRFNPHYSGFEVDVLDGDGNKTDGHMKLGTLRDTYQDDEN